MEGIIVQKDAELEQEKQRAEQLEKEKIISAKKLLESGVPPNIVMDILLINEAFLKKHGLIA